MSAPIEREIKLRFDTPELARAAVERTGATPLRDRRFQEDCLVDSEEETLRRQRSVLRIRNEGHRSVLTFKGPVQPGLMKVREELETVVNDGNLMLQVLERLGLHIWFRYQKYREEFAHKDVVIAVDQKESRGVEQGQGPCRSARAAEDPRFPRIPNPQAECGAVTQCRCQRRGFVVQVEHRVPDPGCRKPPQDPPGQWHTCHRECRLGAEPRERA